MTPLIFPAASFAHVYTVYTPAAEPDPISKFAGLSASHPVSFIEGVVELLDINHPVIPTLSVPDRLKVIIELSEEASLVLEKTKIVGFSVSIVVVVVDDVVVEFDTYVVVVVVDAYVVVVGATVVVTYVSIVVVVGAIVVVVITV